MGGESVLSDYKAHASALLQRAIGCTGLLLVVLVSVLFYAPIGAVVAGERVIAVVEVKLTEFTIEMPTTIPPGRTTFSVTNAGTMEHNFEVEGEGLEQKFDTNLKAGETRNLQVDLPAGVYIVYCPLDDHKQRGMQRELRVAPQQSDSTLGLGK